MKRNYERCSKSTQALQDNLSAGDRFILEGFLKYCRMTACPDRVEKYRRYLLIFHDVVDKPLDQITKEDGIAFWGFVNQTTYQEHTRIDIRKVVRRFLKWHYRDLDMIEPLKVPASYLVNNQRVNKSTLLTEQEIQLMLHRAERLRDKVLLVLLYETAARPQEVRELRWRDINWDEQEVHLYSRKTKEDRDLPLNESIKHLRRWKAEWVYPDPQDEDYIFPSIVGARHDRTKPISVSYINRIIKSIAKKAGINRDVYTYLLRHTRLTEIRKRGVQGIEFNKFAGHKAGSKHENVYVHLDNEDMKRTILEKVYQVKELQATDREKYEARIQRLEQQLQAVVKYLRESRTVMTDVKQHLDPLL